MQNNQNTNARTSFVQAQGLILATLFICILFTGCEKGESPYDTLKAEMKVELKEEVTVKRIDPNGIATVTMTQYGSLTTENYVWRTYRVLEDGRDQFGTWKKMWKEYGTSYPIRVNGQFAIGDRAKLFYINERRTLRNGEIYTQPIGMEIRPLTSP